MKLAGKTKKIVDQSSFRDLVRDPETSRIISSNKYRSNNFLDYDGSDTVRIGLGDYWDYTPLDNNFDFSSNHYPAEVFCDGQLEIDYCEEEPFEISDEKGYKTLRQRLILKARVTKESLSSNFKFIYPGSNTNELLNQYGNDEFFWSYLMKYGLRTSNGKTYLPIVKTNQDFTDHYHEILLPYTQNELDNQPDVRTFSVKYETYYNGRAPSNIDVKLASKGSLPSVSDGNTFYENFIANEGIQNCLPNIYAFAKLTNIPSIAAEQFGLVGEIVHGGSNGENENAPVKLMDYYIFPPAPAGNEETARDRGRIKNDTYANLFRYYPLESNLLLYGAMTLTPDIFSGDNPGPYGPYVQELVSLFNNYSYNLVPKPSLRSLVSLNDKTDSDSLFRQWFNAFQYVLENDPNFNFETSGAEAQPLLNRYGFKPTTKLGALEYSNSILAFSPNAFKSVLEKAQKYKYFFPMFFQMQFTTSPISTVGDLLKNSNLSEYFMQRVASTFSQYGLYEDQTNFTESPLKFSQDPSNNLNFIDFASKNIKIDDNNSNLVLPILENDSPYTVNSKKVIDFVQLIDDLTGDYFTESMALTTGQEANLEGDQNQDGIVHSVDLDNETVLSLWKADIRNYFSYIRDDVTESVDLEPNEIMPLIFNQAALRNNVKDIYNQKARSYKDILDGKKAHTEDLFYVIRKYRNTVDGYANVQNIIVPNTDDLDILTYVDTQVKYGNDATYTYDVFCYRLVYGSRYKYSFIQGTDIPSNSNGEEQLVSIGLEQLVSSAGGSETILNDGLKLQEINGSSWSIGLDKQENDNTVSFTATVNVDVFPSVQLIADRIFSTREVRVLDRPPVPPDVNIVPFRAVNNKIKILLASQTDTIREEPVIILENDSVSFDQLAQSQFSYDGKIEFSSDDSVSSYEVFRIEERPTTYGDFKLHPTIPLAQGSFSSFDDQVLPNKKYYYTFRAIDIHGHFSNPTPVYEVELIDEKGAVKPIIRTISMDPEPINHPIKEAQKYIHIKPSLKQLYFPENEDVDSIFSEKDSAKSKKYKMRITSKKTGKQIDVNFSFDKKVKYNIPV